MTANHVRSQAITEVLNRPAVQTAETRPLSETWATDVFNLSKMEEALSKTAFKAVKKTVKTGEPLDPATADMVAAAMKTWAMSKGAKFFSHVFYPLTNITAEKHDGFIVTNADGHAITEFTGSLLIKGEPDGSSFPNGSLRMTDAARGYTAWDPTSPAYIMWTANGATLMIPSVFMSWTGESLDKKIPLLRSISAMDASARRVLTLMGETDIAPLHASCGPEQEYFLVDQHFAAARPDLLLAGRTLFGAPPAKGQEFDDHYFGAIPERVQVFMQAFEEKLYRLGIPAKTHHNEVAPGQFEIAPYHEDANVAADHQQLLMTVMKATAAEHGFLCLLHEKPFAGLNGSGKHVNWSVGNSTQGNLLDPGTSPEHNLNFLLFCGAVIRGVHKYGPVLRAVIASASNDHRLGANEAPPAILSVYLGDQLEGVYNDIKAGKISVSSDGGVMDLGLSQILNFQRDPGDRNRTSPFAFTGNKFEFRMLGSSLSIAGPNIILNTIVAEELSLFADELEKADDLEDALQEVIRRTIREHKRIIFNGNNYAPEWVEEAEKRGLLNLQTTADALPSFISEKNVALFTKHRIFTRTELFSRYEILMESYCKTLHIEALTLCHMAQRQILPAVSAYTGELVERAVSKKSLSGDISADYEVKTAQKLSQITRGLREKLAELETSLQEAGSIEDSREKALYYKERVRAGMEEARSLADEAESLTAAAYWPFPTYTELLYSV